ncbi:MAG: class I adenylate-forming enzyme family protein, partial [Acidimicrobiia bacterium]
MRTVPDLLRGRATANPGEVAIAVDGIGDLTFGQWDRRSNALARSLVADGCRPGDVVTLSFPDENWLDFAVSYFGVQKAGAVPLILSSRLAPPEIDDARRQAGSHFVITSGALRDGAYGDEPFQVPVEPTSLAEIIQTSGTTGRPKLVAATHANVLYPFMDAAVATRPTTTYVHSLHISTSAAQGLLLLPLHPAAAASAFVVPVFEPDRLCAALARQRATHAVLAPSLGVAIVESGAAERHDVSELRYLSLTGAHAPAALRSRLQAAFPSAAIVVVYGCAEAGPAAVLMVHDPGRPTAVGRPVNRAQVRIAGPGGEVLRCGEVGEVWLRIPGAPTRSYFGDPAATTDVFPGGWTRTGDLAHLDADGFLHIDDRQKDVINCGGLMVSTIEVESVLCS